MNERRAPRQACRPLVFADTAPDIELRALIEAHEFFGADASVRIREGWCALPAAMLLGGRDSGHAWGAHVIVELVDGDDDKARTDTHAR